MSTSTVMQLLLVCIYRKQICGPHGLAFIPVIDSSHTPASFLLMKSGLRLHVWSGFVFVTNPFEVQPWMCFISYLFAPQQVVGRALSKQEVLQQPEETNQTGAERQGRSLSHPQV